MATETISVITKVGESLLSTIESGFLLWLGSILLSKYIEKYKANQSLRVALSSKRAEKIDQVSALLFQVEMDILMLAKEMTVFEAGYRAEGAPFAQWSKKYCEASKLVNDKMLQVYMEIRKAYFMLGPIMCDRFLAHHRMLQDYNRLLAGNKLEEAQAMLNQIEAQKPCVLEFIKNPDV
jgi:hypothetical protein